MVSCGVGIEYACAELRRTILGCRLPAVLGLMPYGEFMAALAEKYPFGADGLTNVCGVSGYSSCLATTSRLVSSLTMFQRVRWKLPIHMTERNLTMQRNLHSRRRSYSFDLSAGGTICFVLHPTQWHLRRLGCLAISRAIRRQAVQIAYHLLCAVSLAMVTISYAFRCRLTLRMIMRIS